ncbi:MAG TPA: hypothetical protein VMU41_19080 [Candidatus Binataceae bacterium]|nr:hypothetical protein [Candidatus Binataceae bacterium]
MKMLTNSFWPSRIGGAIILLAAATSLNACSSISYATSPSEQSKLATQTQQIQKLQSAEYRDDMNAMTFEDNNQTLGNYYADKGAKAHKLIDELEEGHEVSPLEIDQVLNNSDADKYDQRPPVPLDDEIGNGY